MARKVVRSLPFHRVVMRFAAFIGVAAATGLVASGMAIPFVHLTGVAAKSGVEAMNDLPLDIDMGELSQTTRILDAHGKVITTLYDQNRSYKVLDQISANMPKALLAIEDTRFYEHGAMDLKGTLRALLRNSASESGSVQGGSSITQQLVKTTLVYGADTDEERAAATEKSTARKIRELRYAIWLEEHHDKDWILERYLNAAYFGDSAYGVQAAAKHYFGVDAADLTWGQASMLAGMVKNPTGYDPTDYPDATVARRNLVLERLAQVGDLPRAEAEKLKESELGLNVQDSRNGCFGSSAEFFCDYALQWLLADESLGETEAERWRLLQTGGLTIKTSLDSSFQKAAQRSVSGRVSPTDNAVGALAMVEPGTGNVKALAQSRPMGENRRKGESYLNYLVPKEYGDANGFQAGSTFKVFVGAAAIEKGFPLRQEIPSPPKKTFNQASFANCPGQGNFSPNPYPVGNSTTSGNKNLYTGTRESVNTFYVRLEQFTGVCAPYTLAKKMGISLTDPAHERVPSFTLGPVDVSPLEMAEAYATFGARGKHCDSRPVTAIIGPDGKTMKEYASSCEQVMRPSTADAMNDILRGVLQPGGFGQKLALSVPSAGKTGTTNSNRAVWFNGYTPKLATASMIAGANYEGNWVTLNGQRLRGGYVASASGSTVAGPMWADAMRAVDNKLGSANFVRPGAAVVNGKGIKIPKVEGLSVAKATARLKSAGFKPVVGKRVRSHWKKGTVVGTVPGSRAIKGATVEMLVSRWRR
ncbi:transglycosylase domain-containing protein [Nocardioides panzhihuensis]|uniref:Membrane peptidoglycan carboxypeptidase n=1 Tax=Nocardioides panzhihuensis TaxID=860243 RepID=A0A7Z0DQ36_9ACTN|nr:transglycosylase domain-containing protein [Nocardioides panzhihuensis]NYI79709.1 membrane peptidoglycan carboxypeptidase [Nocardioides panzhihuensis]